MNTLARALLNRAKEPSSWAGLAILASVLHVPDATFQLVAQAGAALAALLAMALPESK